MPRGKEGTRAGKSHPGMVKCRCKTRCLRFNAERGLYEGNGEDVTPKTRSEHKRDERLFQLLQQQAEPRDVPAKPIGLEELLGDDLRDDEAIQNRWEELIEAHINVLRDIPVGHGGGGYRLDFSNSPKEYGPYEFEYSEDAEIEGRPYRLLSAPFPNMGTHSLTQGAPCNRRYLERENTLWGICRTLESFRETDATRRLHQDAYQLLFELEQEKCMVWENVRDDYVEGPVFNTATFFRKRTQKARVVDAASLVALALQFQFFLPRRGTEVYLSGATDILSLATPTSAPLFPPNLPRDPRPLAGRFNLDPLITTYVSCLGCHCLYPFALADTDNPVPERCTFRQTPASTPCNSDLWKRVNRGPLGEIKVPIRKYLYQSLKSWLGRLLSRRGMERLVHDYPRSLLGADDVNADPRVDGPREPPEIKDIWQGDVFRRIVDPDGHGQPFFPGPAGELRVAFSMSVDGFQTFQMKTAKQSSSSTGIWLVLLNLPPHLRYLPQNMYLAGVIPGPQKPSNDEINHYVKLIVGELQDLWRPGVRFSRTHDFQNGRVCKGMLIPLVCDLLGAHQLVGYPGSPNAHYFCTCCELDIDDINIIDPDQWPKKNIRHIRRFAQLYRDAESESHQQLIFEACGWRWSPLFELEYWDPSVFTVIDSMHSLDLNVLKHHIHNLFQIDTKRARGDALREPSTERVKRVVAKGADISALEKCQNAVYENPPKLLYELLQFHRKVLYSFCLDYDIPAGGLEVVAGTRWVLSKAIYQWRQNEDLETVNSFLRRHPRLSPQQQSLIEEHKAKAEMERSPRKGKQPLKSKGEYNNAGDGSMERESVDNHGAEEMEEENAEAGPSVHRAPPKVNALRRAVNRLVNLAEDFDEEESGLLYTSITLSMLEEVSRVISLDPPPDIRVRGASKTAKRVHYDFVLEQLVADSDKREELRMHFSEDKRTSASDAFLGKEVMEAVWKDMKSTQLPSWVTPAPLDWGTSRRGKLSADNWRVICCIHLPITLIRLFGDAIGRPRDLLDNFMQLVSAVRIATMRTSSREHVRAYNQQIFAYTRGVLDLYPDYNILPSHHAALHIGDMLHRFGPKHSHDSPHYERYIHFFHRMNTNHKLGEVEGTFLRTASRNANLLSLLSDSTEDRDLVSEMVSRIQTHERERLRGFRLAEALDPFSPPNMAVPEVQLDSYYQDGVTGDLPNLEFDLLSLALQAKPDLDIQTPLSRNVTFLKAISHRQSIYSVWESSRFRDSAVLIGDGETERAGVIQTIFLHRYPQLSGNFKTDAYLTVKAYENVDDDDPYRRYGRAGGFCCKPNHTSLRLVALESVLCHVAVTRFESDDPDNPVHVLPVNRELFYLEANDFLGAASVDSQTSHT